MIAGIASKLFSDRDDHTETKFSFYQGSPMIATITIAGIESESISAIAVIVNDRQRSQKLMETTSSVIAAIVTIVMIPAIIWKS